MTSIYHSGELDVQNRVGVQAEASHLGRLISSSIKPPAQDFVQSQRLAVASSIAVNGQVWSSLLTGQPGFIQTVAAHILRIDATPVPGDPLYENLTTNGEIGILVIDLATRRRLRLNGKAEVSPQGGIYVHTRQVYFNCPKYIQARDLKSEAIKPLEHCIERTEILTEKQQSWVAQADTFFIASFYPESGADVSHRGGYPGFVQVLNPHALVFPDYSGNNMFNTLGNITVNPQAGLLFIDFQRGSALQVTGRAYIIWDTERAAEFPGAERLVELQIDQVIQITDASPLRGRFLEYSPANPAL